MYLKHVNHVTNCSKSLCDFLKWWCNSKNHIILQIISSIMWCYSYIDVISNFKELNNRNRKKKNILYDFSKYIIVKSCTDLEQSITIYVF